MYSSAYVWAKVLGHMEQRLTDPIVSTWFDEVEVVEYKDNKLVLYAPSDFRRDIIERRCGDYIRDAMLELFDVHVELTVLGEKEMQTYQERGRQPNFLEMQPGFTFDNFVVGSCNRFAHAAAVAVANAPAQTYNPLFIYGPSGLGKTHLLYAIASQIQKDHPDYNIVYIKGDQFTNELIAAIKEGRNIEFRNKYRNADLFLIDDIQFIAGKNSSQEEFFHTFNELYEKKRQIVMTSDRPPNEMQLLEERLRTRFEWGLLADIQPPDYETRMAIIGMKALCIGLELPPDVCSFVADSVTMNVRQIEGTLKKILAYKELNSMPVDVAHVSRAIKDMYKGKAEAVPTSSLIIGEVCRYYSIEEDILRGTLKNKATAEARQVAMYLIRKLTSLSLPDIGREFGRDHSTVIHSLNKVDKLIADSTNNLNDTIREITANVNSKL